MAKRPVADSRTPTYEEYVGTRWASLYRTAYRLTGSRPDAEDLVQATLVKACQAWSRIGRADSRDDDVRRILTDTFRGGRDPLRGERDRLVAQLPGLADVDASAADLEVPVVPDVALLRELAERDTARRRGRRLAVLAGVTAAAVVAAVVLGFRADGPDGGPPVVPTPSPSYYADGTPYVQDFRLYVAHRQQAGTWLGVVRAGPFAVAQRFDGEPAAGTSVVAFRDGRRLTTADGIRLRFGDPRLSAGGTVAWLEEVDGSGVLVARSLVTGAELGRVGTGIPLASENEGTPVQLDIVRDDGTVFYTTTSGGDPAPTFWRWKPGREPRRVAEDAYPESSSLEEGLPDEPGVRLGPDGLWLAWYSDPDGTGEYRSLTVQKPGDVSSRFTVPLPDAASIVVLGWSSPTTVETYGSDDGPSYTCDIGTRTCTAVPEPY